MARHRMATSQFMCALDGSPGELLGWHPGEFHYVQGVVKGTWNWGMVGRVNGAILSRDAFDYLSKKLKEVL